MSLMGPRGTVRGVWLVDLFAGCGDPLAGGDDSSVANEGHQIAVAARLRPEHAEAVLGVAEGDPLHKAGANFLGRWFRRWLHEAARIACFLFVRHSADAAGGLPFKRGRIT